MKKRFTRMTSPVGTALWPHLNEPDTKFNKDGDYKVSLIVDEEEAAPLISEMQKVLSDFKNSGQSRSKKDNTPPLREATPEELAAAGLEGDYVVFKFKMRAVGVSGGERWEQRPILFDSQGKPTVARIGNNSKIKVGFEIVPYSTPATGNGITLRLKAVQVIELREISSGQSFDSWGFTQQDGFTAGTETVTQGASDNEPEDESYDW